jgi:hypothetical protein
MKKLLVLTMVLASFVSYGQTYHIRTISKKVKDDPKKYTADIIIGDNTIKLIEFGKTITYQIKSVEGLDKDYIFKVTDLSNVNTLSEVYYNDEEKFISITYLIKRLNGDNLSSTTYYYFNNKQNDIVDNKSFGGDVGYSMFLGSSSSSNISYGGWIDFGKIGIEYHTSVGITNDLNATDFLSGKSNDWTAGGISRSFGVFTKENEFYYGGGIQFVELYGLKNVTSGRYSYPTLTNDNKVYPYGTIGYIGKLGDLFTLKAGLIISAISSVNVGVGYNF